MESFLQFDLIFWRRGEPPYAPLENWILQSGIFWVKDPYKTMLKGRPSLDSKPLGTSPLQNHIFSL